MNLPVGIALYNFEAREDDELTILKGEEFNILEKYDDGWWLVDCKTQQGMVPSNYVREIDKNTEQAESFRGKYERKIYFLLLLLSNFPSY